MKHSWHCQFLTDQQSIDGSSAFAGAVAGQSLSIVSSDLTSPRELSMTLEDNFMINRFLKAIGAERYKTYRIFETTIT